MNIKQKRHEMVMEQYGAAIAGHRTLMYHQANMLAKALQALLEQESNKKQFEHVDLSTYTFKNITRRLRVVYFNTPIRFSNPKGTKRDPFVYSFKLIRMSATKLEPAEWVLDLGYGDLLYMRDLTIDDLLLLSDRLFDPDCSLDPAWMEKGGSTRADERR